MLRSLALLMSIVTPVEVELQLFGEIHWVPRTAWSPFFLRGAFPAQKQARGSDESSLRRRFGLVGGRRDLDVLRLLPMCCTMLYIGDCWSLLVR